LTYSLTNPVVVYHAVIFLFFVGGGANTRNIYIFFSFYLDGTKSYVITVLSLHKTHKKISGKNLQLR